MSETVDHQMVNTIRKEKALIRKRREILAQDAEAALDAILGADQPARLIQSFSDQDLYYLMHHIGPDDFLPILSLATSAQWEYLLDMDGWNKDRMDLVQMTRCLDLLLQADAKRLLRWTITEKPEFIEFYLFKNVELRILEHDEDPSDFGDDFHTLDKQFYFRFPPITEEMRDAVAATAPAGADDQDHDLLGELEKNRERAESLITRMLETLAEMDLSVCQAVLMEAATIIPSETEEEQYRLRNVRLAEKGFLPHHQAAGIYQPLDKSAIPRRSGTWLNLPRLGTDLPVPPLFSDAMLPEQSLFARSLAQLEDTTVLLNLQSEFVSLVNQLISADQQKIRGRGEMENEVGKAGGYISVGMEMIHGTDRSCTPGDGAAIITTYCLGDIFRVASGAAIRLRRVARKWMDSSWLRSRELPLTLLGEAWMGTIGGVLLERPLFYDDQAVHGRYRTFSSLAEMRDSARTLSRIQAMDTLLSSLAPDIPDRLKGRLSYKSVIFTLWARETLGLSPVLEYIPLQLFSRFFEGLFPVKGTGIHRHRIPGTARDNFREWLCAKSGKTQLAVPLASAIREMLDELEEEYGGIHRFDIEPDLLEAHFLVHRQPGSAGSV